MALKRTLSVEQIIQMYREGESTTVIAERANVSARYIRLILNENNVEMRPRGSWKRKYRLNEHYFKEWSDNMAYILGFFIADGTITRDLQTVSISQKEKYILEDIRNEIGSNQPLYFNDKTGVYILTLNSKILKSDLINLHGIQPNKSKDVQFPYVPEQYLNDFIRGYFDGDGCVKYEKYFVSFVGGSKPFMIKLREIIEKQNFATNFTDHETHFRVYVSGRKTIKQFSDWMYKHKGLYLHRKYAEFQKETLPIKELNDSIKTHKNALAKRRSNGGV
ncbi:LAGLIDADG family homing endonuclease [Oceanobacillus bengalensis]|uniref:Endonuclease n=1 Tax=Oceanobacillus bengalensis TaxID=1435466 RepID=A0A494YUU1_9BACI|nr:LAGLIDADG family homing endonuclease [Oceanobacillus bengalensis]RKQ13899.1 endonuclease [Oceanobacillus bengalensis]